MCLRPWCPQFLSQGAASVCRRKEAGPPPLPTWGMQARPEKFQRVLSRPALLLPRPLGSSVIMWHRPSAGDNTFREHLWALYPTGWTPVVKNPPANAGDVRGNSSVPGSGRSPGRGHGNSLQYSCLDDLRDRGSWRGYSPQDGKELDTTEATFTHTTVWNKNELLRKLKTFFLGHPPKDLKFSWGSRKHQSCSVTFHENSLDFVTSMKGLPRWLSNKEYICQCRRRKRHRFDPWVGKIPGRRAWQPTPVFFPGETHEQRSLLGYIP